MICFVIHLLLLLVASQDVFTFHISNTTLIQSTVDHFAAIYNESLYIMQITANSSRLESIKFPFNASSWIEHPLNLELPFPVEYVDASTTIFIKDQFYMINLIRTQYVNNSLFAYNLNSNHFYNLSIPLQHILRGFCSVHNPINNVIYMIGGVNSSFHYFPTTRRFNMSNMQWIDAGDSMHIARAYSGCSLNSNNTNIYYFGGLYNGLTSTMDIERYDVILDQWHLINATLTQRRYHLLCRLLSLNNHIYCIGGIRITTAGLFPIPFNVVDIFDTEHEIVSKQITLNMARSQFTATLWNNDRCIIVCGGQSLPIMADPSYSIEYLGQCPGITTQTAITNTTDSMTSSTDATTSTTETTRRIASTTTESNADSTETGIAITDRDHQTTEEIIASTHSRTVSSILQSIYMPTVSVDTTVITSTLSTLSKTEHNGSGVFALVAVLSLSVVIAVSMFVFLYYWHYEKNELQCCASIEDTLVKCQDDDGKEVSLNIEPVVVAENVTSGYLKDIGEDGNNSKENYKNEGLEMTVEGANDGESIKRYNMDMKVILEKAETKNTDDRTVNINFMLQQQTHGELAVFAPTINSDV